MGRGPRLGGQAEVRLQRGSVVLVSLDPTRGHEPRGTRPCVVVSDTDVTEDQRFPLVAVVPISSTAGTGAFYPLSRPAGAACAGGRTRSSIRSVRSTSAGCASLREARDGRDRGDRRGPVAVSGPGLTTPQETSSWSAGVSSEVPPASATRAPSPGRRPSGAASEKHPGSSSHFRSPP